MQDELAEISKARSALMGCAMLAVMLFHQFFTTFPGSFVFHWYGDLGVDMFLFLSGFGIYHSLRKRHSGGLRSFYCRRFIRIIPAAVIAGIFVTIPLGGDTMEYWPLCILGLNLWYVRAIIILYILSPFILSLFEKSRRQWTIFLLISACSMAASSLVLYSLSSKLGIYHPLVQTTGWTLARLPIFAFGLFLPIRHESGKGKLPCFHCAVAAMLLSLPAAFCRSPLSEIPPDLYCHIPLYMCYAALIPLVYLSARAASKLFSLVTPVALRPLQWVGTFSLEIYLVHEAVFGFIDKHCGPGWMSFLAAFMLSFLLASLLHWIAAPIQDWLSSHMYRKTTNS